MTDFLRRARSKCDPARAGLPADTRVRRVPGLRREEVALLAGVSTDYYSRLEQGRRIVPSPSVLTALGRALELDAAGQAHLQDLVGSPSAPQRPRVRGVQRVRPGLRQLLDSLDSAPAMVLGRRTNVLAANRMARHSSPTSKRCRLSTATTPAGFCCTRRRASCSPDWEVQARAAVENLRLEFGTDPHDRALRDLVSELRRECPEFRLWWDEHRVYQRTHGSKRLQHPVVGHLTVEYETLTLPGDADSTLYLYTTAPCSPSRQALDLLASWTLSAPTGSPSGSRQNQGRSSGQD